MSVKLVNEKKIARKYKLIINNIELKKENRENMESNSAQQNNNGVISLKSPHIIEACNRQGISGFYNFIICLLYEPSY